VVTEIDADFEGDAFAPMLGPDWQESARSRPALSSGLGYSVVTYRRRAD
jgi:dihydrofolate reductase